MKPAVGLDFGTTNSALAVVGAAGRAELVHFSTPRGERPTWRSVLYFDRPEEARGPVRCAAGPAAIARYLAAEEKNGRLVQSLKSFLASRLFQATEIFGSTWRLEALIGELLRALREEAERRVGLPIERAVVGRPVRFVHASDASDEELALARLRAALANAGFAEVHFELEPLGAAYHYESRLDADELVLIADFGGGTSDFSLLRVGPGREAGAEAAVLGHAGVALAGDAFDGKIVRHLVAPRLGRGGSFRSLYGNEAPVPGWVYSHLERWHHLSFLKSRKTLQVLLDLRRDALDPEPLDALLHVVREDLGYLLFRSVESAKRALSRSEETRFVFEHEELRIDAPLRRVDFEAWIAEELEAIAGGVDGLLGTAGVARREVDRVFLTGGTSLVPAVRRIFADRFGADRLRSGGEFTSVASGLALRARSGAFAPVC